MILVVFIIMNTTILGVAVAKRRKRLGLDQRALAEIAGISVHALSNIETGKGNPTLKTLSALADILGMEIRIEVRQAPAQDEAG